MTFSELLTKRLNELDLSLSDFATRLTLNGYAVTKSGVANWKSGDRMPKIINSDYRKALARTMEIDVNTMMGVLHISVSDDDRSTEALRGAELIDQMDERQRRVAIGVLEAMLEA